MWILRIRVQKAYDQCTAGRPRSTPSWRNSGSACSQPPSGAISTEASHRSGRWRATSSTPPVRRAACFAVTSFTASSCREATPACSVHPARLRICLGPSRPHQDTRAKSENLEDRKLGFDASFCRSRLTASSGCPAAINSAPLSARMAWKDGSNGRRARSISASASSGRRT
jgi:hypothetical protein